MLNYQMYVITHYTECNNDKFILRFSPAESFPSLVDLALPTFPKGTSPTGAPFSRFGRLLVVSLYPETFFDFRRI